MKGRSPCEVAVCPRCGLTRTVNAGLKRKAQSTDLCRACWAATLTSCPVCNLTCRNSGLGSHIKWNH